MVISPLHIFKALADETRLRIINILRFHDFNVNELVTILNMGQTRISRHLKILTDSEILQFKREGLWVFYSVTASSFGADFLKTAEPFLNREPHFAEDRERAKEMLEKARIQTRSFFNSLADEWKTMKQDIFGSFNMKSILLEHLQKCGTVADLGCGTGDFLPALLEKAEKVIGVDASKSMLEKAQKSIEHTPFSEKIELRLGEIEHLPLGDNEADCALVNMVLHHLPSPASGLREAWRVIKPGKTLIIADFAKHSDESLRSRFGDRRLGFTAEDLEKIITESGFSIKHQQKYPLKKGLSILLYTANKEYEYDQNKG